MVALGALRCVCAQRNWWAYLGIREDYGGGGMKAISLWEPWATFMALGLKKNETRHWPTSYRGPLLIHAAKRKMTRAEFKTMRQIIDYKIGMGNLSYGMLYELQYGNVVCQVDLIDCQQIRHEICPKICPSGVSKNWKERAEYYFGNYDYGRFMWVTGNLKQFEDPIPYKGKQGFFNVPDEIIKGALE